MPLVPAVLVQDLKVSFPRERGVLGVLLLIPWFAKAVAFLARFPLMSNLGKCLTRIQVIDSLNLSIPRGSVFGIFGVNGAGKSTVLRSITGMEPFDSGSVFVHGMNINGVPAKDLARIISRGSRELSPDMTCLENIEFNARLFGLDPAGSIRTAKKLLRILGLSEVDFAKYPSQVNLGTFGKVALVRALIPLLCGKKLDSAEPNSGPQVEKQSPILVLDEPTLGFDPIAVAEFFAAAIQLKQALPNLTVVIATNDPREMAFCDEQISIIDGHARHDAAAFSELKGSMSYYRAAIRAAATIIGRPLPEDGVTAAAELKLEVIPWSAEKPAAALAWRHWRDLSRHRLDSLVIVMGLIIPNLTALFAAERNAWDGLIMATLGVLATLMVREACRFLARERDYYCMLETLLGSPMSRLEHFAVTARCSILTQCCFTAAFTVCLGLLLSDKVGSEFALNAHLLLENGIGIGLVLLGTILLSYAVGILTALIPFMAKSPIATFFFVSIVPMLLILCGGVYNDVALLPPGLRHIACLNPLSYAAQALSDFLNLKRHSALPLSEEMMRLFPQLPSGWANVIVTFGLGIPCLALAAVLFHAAEPLLRKGGRLRNVRG